LEADPSVSFVASNTGVYAFAETLDWGVNRIDAEVVHTSGNLGTGVRVAILDSGIDQSHPDLSPVELGADYVGSGAEHWHGTHVAGIVGARRGNSQGVIGVAPGATLVEVRILATDGSGEWGDIVEAIGWASTQGGCKVVNLSVGGYPTTAVQDAITNAVNAAIAQGAVVVCAAGNENTSQKSWPAGAPNAIAVGSIDSKNKKSSFSNWGSWVDCNAPGSSIRSTYPGGYATASGTSMASPMVAGVAALLLASDPGLSPASIDERLKATGDTVSSPVRPIGKRVDAEEAVLGTQSGNN
jgi:subtilisin